MKSDKTPFGEKAKNKEIIFQTEIPHVKNKIPHYKIIKQLYIIDFDLGNKLLCARLPVYKGFGSRFWRTLINFFLEEKIKQETKEHVLPMLLMMIISMAKGKCLIKKKTNEKVNGILHLILTVEVYLTNIYPILLSQKKIC